jgi:hypothetical protein
MENSFSNPQTRPTQNEAFLRVSHSKSMMEDRQGVIERLCRNAMSHLDCRLCFIFLIDEAAGQLRLVAFYGISEEDARKIGRLDYGLPRISRGDGQEISHIDDLRAELSKSYGVRAYASHLLVVRGRIVGILSFGTNTRAHFSSGDLSLMERVSGQVAAAVERIGRCAAGRNA